MKIAYGIIFRLLLLIAVIWQLTNLSDGITINAVLVLLIFLVPECQLQWARRFATAPILTEKSPIAMLVLGLLYMGVLLTTDETYTGTVPSIVAILGYVLFVKWVQSVQFNGPLNKTLALPEFLQGYRQVWILHGPSNAYDWPIWRAVASAEDVALLCVNAGSWSSERVRDDEAVQQFIKQLGGESFPPGGGMRLDIEAGRITNVVREASKRVRPSLS